MRVLISAIHGHHQELFAYWNSYTATVLVLNVSVLFHFRRSPLEIHLLENLTPYFYLRYILPVASVFLCCTCRCSIISVTLLSLLLCAL
jgi:hypothetical protein